VIQGDLNIGGEGLSSRDQVQRRKEGKRTSNRQIWVAGHCRTDLGSRQQGQSTGTRAYRSQTASYNVIYMSQLAQACTYVNSYLKRIHTHARQVSQAHTYVHKTIISGVYIHARQVLRARTCMLSRREGCIQICTGYRYKVVQGQSARGFFQVCCTCIFPQWAIFPVREPL
jgi:hypothetical protein